MKKLISKLSGLFQKETPDMNEKIGIVRRKAILRMLKDGRQK